MVFAKQNYVTEISLSYYIVAKRLHVIMYKIRCRNIFIGDILYFLEEPLKMHPKKQ